MNEPAKPGRVAPVDSGTPETAVPAASTQSQITGDYVPGEQSPPIAMVLASSDRYALGEMIGKGGMGAVYRAQDRSLNRDLAFKVLLADPNEKPELVRRFYQEAEITGQLQHPGVVPIHEIGLLPDGRPFFSMKLVEGHTLAQLLKDRKIPSDLPRFLKIFEQICQTVAFAHSRQIIHRDLKPANVMVGSFGEVQVMDWGLAKKVGSGQRELGRKETAVDADDPHTRAGAILGTLAYMPPEQARGEIENLDERSDVFSLGAILCEILTGSPPYGNERGATLLKLAADADLKGAFARLESCGVDSELIALAKHCLAPAQQARPSSANVVAAAILAYQSGVEDRLRLAEVERARAEARTAEERKRRRVQMALAAAVVLILGLSAGGAWWYQKDRAALQRREQEELNAKIKREQEEQNERADRDRQEFIRQTSIANDVAVAARVGTELLRSDSDKDLADNPELWRQKIVAAQTNLKTADNLLRTIARSPAAADIVEKFHTEISAHDKEQTLIATLEQLRLADSIGGLSPRQLAQQYEKAFIAYGLDVRKRDIREVESYLKQHPRREWLLAGLYAWWSHVHSSNSDDPIDQILFQIRPADDLMDRLALALLPPNSTQKVDTLMKLPMIKVLPVGRANRLAERLNDHQRHDHALELLKAAVAQHPDDYRANYELGRTYIIMRPARPAEAMPYLRAALAIRPRSSAANTMIGIALRRLNDLKQALVYQRKAVELDPHWANGHVNLAAVQSDLGDVEGAMASCLRALELEPDSTTALVNLAAGLNETGDVHGAIACYYEALAINETKDDAAVSLGYLLLDNDEVPEATRMLRLAMRWGSSKAETHIFAARIHEKKEEYERAAVEYKEAIRRDPKEVFAYTNYALMLRDRKDLPAAIAMLRKAVEIDPENFSAIGTIGSMLRDQGQFADALEQWRRAAKLMTPGSALHSKMLRAIKEVQPLVQLETKLAAHLAGQIQPKTAVERAKLAAFARRYKRMPLTAERLFAEAFAADPNLVSNPEETYALQAAKAAIQAAFDLGDDCKNLTAAEKTRLRKQGLEWLKKDFAICKKDVLFNPSRRDEALKELNAYRTAPEFGPLRHPLMLATLPAPERDAWLEWWEEWREVLGTK